MTKKTWIKVKVGLLKPKHQSAIGPSIWLYLYLVDNANWEDGVVYGYTDEQASTALGIPQNTLLKHRHSLEKKGYITASKSVHDQMVVIHEWTNPRKYSGELLNPQDVGSTYSQSDQQSDRQTDHQSNHQRLFSLMNDSHITYHTSEKRDAASAASTPEDRARDRIRMALEKRGIDTTDLLSHVATSRVDQGNIDLSKFPEPYRIVLERFCRLWRVEPPIKVGGKSGAFGDWIVSARELMTAYGEYGPELLDVVYWSGDWLKADGTPMTIGRPGAVLKYVSSWCGNLRQRGTKSDQLNTIVESLMPRFQKKASKDVMRASANLAADRTRVEQDARARGTKQ